MVLTNPNTLMSKARADQVLAEQAVIKQYVQEMAALRRRVRAYEEQFGIPSDEVHEAIEDGRLQETLEVCDWIMDIELLTWSISVGQ